MTETDPVEGAPTGAPLHIRRVSPALAATVGVAFLVLLGLGTWQLDRLAWKQDLLARIDVARTAPAQPLDVVLHRLDQDLDIEFTRVQVDCADYSGRIVYLYSLHEGAPGWRPITACRLTSGPNGSILIDLGFQPGEAGAAPSPQTLTLAPDTPIVGVLRRPSPEPWFERLAPRPPSADGRQWLKRDIPGMAAALGADNPAPLMLMLESPSGGPGLVASPLPVGLSNRHLVYAVTWYGLALALAAVYIAKLLRDRKA